VLTIDGSFGEGGGQILRSALTLAGVTGRPCRIDKIRARRPKSGLMHQHLTAVHAAARICDAQLNGAAIGSARLTFEPKAVRSGEYEFSVGTAGSTTLVLQTVLLPLLTAGGPSRIVLQGGTHNPFAPPFDFLEKTWLPFINRMGPTVRARLERPGFYPAGGGRLVVEIEPADRLKGFELLERGSPTQRNARAVVANLPRHIAERETALIRQRLEWPAEAVEIVELSDPPGPGNVVMISLGYEHVTKVFTAFGERKRSAEAVADDAVRQCQGYLTHSAPAGEHLTDQLLLPLALAGAGAFRSTGLSPHAETNLHVIRQFLDLPIATAPDDDGGVRVQIGFGGSRVSRVWVR